MVGFEDDSWSELKVTLRIGCEEGTLALHNEAERKVAASDGWIAFVPPKQAPEASQALIKHQPR